MDDYMDIAGLITPDGFLNDFPHHCIFEENYQNFQVITKQKGTTENIYHHPLMLVWTIERAGLCTISVASNTLKELLIKLKERGDTFIENEKSSS